jgi:hypothetical protein
MIIAQESTPKTIEVDARFHLNSSIFERDEESRTSRKKLFELRKADLFDEVSGWFDELELSNETLEWDVIIEETDDFDTEGDELPTKSSYLFIEGAVVVHKDLESSRGALDAIFSRIAAHQWIDDSPGGYKTTITFDQ